MTPSHGELDGSCCGSHIALDALGVKFPDCFSPGYIEEMISAGRLMIVISCLEASSGNIVNVGWNIHKT